MGPRVQRPLQGAGPAYLRNCFANRKVHTPGFLQNVALSRKKREHEGPAIIIIFCFGFLVSLFKSNTSACRDRLPSFPDSQQERKINFFTIPNYKTIPAFRLCLPSVLWDKQSKNKKKILEKITEKQWKNEMTSLMLVRDVRKMAAPRCPAFATLDYFPQSSTFFSFFEWSRAVYSACVRLGCRDWWRWSCTQSLLWFFFFHFRCLCPWWLADKMVDTSLWRSGPRLHLSSELLLFLLRCFLSFIGNYPMLHADIPLLSPSQSRRSKKRCRRQREAETTNFPGRSTQESTSSICPVI